LKRFPVVRRLRCAFRLVLMESWIPRGEIPVPRATFENGRVDGNAARGAGAMAALLPPAEAFVSVKSCEELKDWATSAADVASRAEANNVLKFMNRISVNITGPHVLVTIVRRLQRALPREIAGAVRKVA